MSAYSAEHARLGGQRAKRIAGQVAELPEVVPPRVREVLVELDVPDEFGPGHDPPPTLLQQRDPDLATQLVVDVTTDAEREVDPLRLEPRDLRRISSYGASSSSRGMPSSWSSPS